MFWKITLELKKKRKKKFHNRRAIIFAHFLSFYCRHREMWCVNFEWKKKNDEKNYGNVVLFYSILSCLLFYADNREETQTFSHQTRTYVFFLTLSLLLLNLHLIIDTKVWEKSCQTWIQEGRKEYMKNYNYSLLLHYHN